MMTRALRSVLVVGLLAPVLAAGQAEPIRIVELAGDGVAIGQAHGRLLKGEINLLHERYVKPFLSDQRMHQRALMAAFVFMQQLSPEHKAELRALADAAGVGPGEAMLGNCFLDLIAINACSTITLPADASPDGVARFGRNLDFPSMNIADKHSLVMIVRPKDRYAFAAVTWPGLVGALSGMNEHGLTLANMEVNRTGGLPQAMPYTLLYRTLLERCKTVDEAIALLKTSPRQTANNLMLMDAAGNRAVAEITPQGVTVRRGQAKMALISTNHHRGADQGTRGRCRRYDALRAESARSYGNIGVAKIEAMLGQVAQGRLTLQSMVFEPANRVMYLAVGSEATRREYQRIELKRYFHP